MSNQPGMAHTAQLAPAFANIPAVPVESDFPSYLFLEHTPFAIQ
jgi:hypothetical protein